MLALFWSFVPQAAFGMSAPRLPDEATAKTLEGRTASIADHRGKAIFLNVWRTDCVACLFEMPLLNRLQKEYSSEAFTVIGVSLDRGKDKLVAMMVEKRNIVYPVWLGYGQPISDYVNTPALPTLFAIGPNGEVLGYRIGAFATYDQMVGAMKQARRLIKTRGRAK